VFAIEKVLAPRLLALKYELPQGCPLDTRHNMFAVQEEHKELVRKNVWKCTFDSKVCALLPCPFSGPGCAPLQHVRQWHDRPGLARTSRRTCRINSPVYRDCPALVRTCWMTNI
jgi:hypothetical protein